MCSTSILYIINSIILEIKPLFVINLYQFTINNDNIPYLIDSLYKIKSKDPKGNIASNKGGYQSNELSNTYPFSSLSKYVSKKISDFFNKPYKINSIWGNISSQYSYNVVHSHSQFIYDDREMTNHLSGVIYLKIPKNSGNINFYNPRFMTEYYSHIPIVGEVLIFPSILAHNVDMNLSPQDRISLAFNSSSY